jgi:hypothetical protein
VREARNLWQVWEQGKAYSTRPSQLMGLGKGPAAFYFDRAVTVFGQALEADLKATADSRKTESAKNMAVSMRMNTWIGGAQQFRDPASVKRG